MIIDLRDYTTMPGARDLLIARCEEELFPAQRCLGADIMGIFRDADDMNRFVWLRGMASLAERRRILTAFYTNGELWHAQRAEVNSWIADASNVLLVRPISGWGEPVGGDTQVGMFSFISRTPLTEPATKELQNMLLHAITAAGGHLLVVLETDPSKNNYPRHAIRTGEHGLIWLASFPLGQQPTLGLPNLQERRLLPGATSRLR
jgi:hypothetical protein